VTDETTINEEKVRKEHEKDVRQPIQWLYLLGVLVGGTVLMLIFVAFLGTGGG
jgi:hypothetical protein